MDKDGYSILVTADSEAISKGDRDDGDAAEPVRDPVEDEREQGLEQGLEEEPDPDLEGKQEPELVAKRGQPWLHGGGHDASSQELREGTGQAESME